MKVWKVTPNEAKLDIQQYEVNTRKPKKGEVCVRIHATSINKRDLYIANKGFTQNIKEQRFVPFSDGAGEVIAIGEGVNNLCVGDRVMNMFWRDWVDGELTHNAIALGSMVDGVLAEEVVLPEHALIKIPQSLSYEEAATLPCAALTAWNALMETGQLKSGQTVLTLGTGGVSLFALQFAKAAGAKVIITSSSDEKLARAKKMGADFAINYRTNPNWSEEVMRLTEHKGANLIIETGGPETLNHSLQASSFNGQIVIIGAQAGADQGISPLPILFKKLCLQGIMVGSKKMFENMLDQISRHNIKPVIDEVFSFEDVPKAYKKMGAANHFGKIVIVN